MMQFDKLDDDDEHFYSFRTRFYKSYKIDYLNL